MNAFKTWEAAVVAGNKDVCAEEAARCFKIALEMMPVDHPMRKHIEDAYNNRVFASMCEGAAALGIEI